MPVPSLRTPSERADAPTGAAPAYSRRRRSRTGPRAGIPPVAGIAVLSGTTARGGVEIAAEPTSRQIDWMGVQVPVQRGQRVRDRLLGRVTVGAFVARQPDLAEQLLGAVPGLHLRDPLPALPPADLDQRPGPADRIAGQMQRALGWSHAPTLPLPVPQRLDQTLRLGGSHTPVRSVCP